MFMKYGITYKPDYEKFSMKLMEKWNNNYFFECLRAFASYVNANKIEVYLDFPLKLNVKLLLISVHLISFLQCNCIKNIFIYIKFKFFFFFFFFEKEKIMRQLLKGFNYVSEKLPYFLDEMPQHL